MILKTAANYNDEGGYIEAWKNSDGTTEVKLIPKSGGDEDKQGLKSITISPAITTTPALDSLFPIYYGDLEDSPIPGSTRFAEFELKSEESVGGNYTVIITPTSDWQLYDEANQTMLGKGVPLSIEYENIINPMLINANAYADPDDDDAPVIALTIEISENK